MHRSAPVATVTPCFRAPWLRGAALAALLALALGAAPLHAQDAAPEEPGLMERGIDMFLRGLMDEVGPEIGQMQEALKSLAPELQNLVEMMGDVQNYQPPERLPNGDILIRRKPGAPPVPAGPEAETQGGDAIDL